MRVCAIDTSGPATSVGFADPHGLGPVVTVEGARRHAEVIDEVFARALSAASGGAPQAVCVGVGPGPYSGLRVGVAFGVGLARAWSVPVVGMCSLDAIAWEIAEVSVPGGSKGDDRDAGRDGNSDPDREFVVTADAKRQEIYWARYDQQGNRVEGPQVTRRDDANFTVPTIDGMKPDPARMAYRAALLLAAGDGPVPVPREWGPHGSDGSAVGVPAGALLAPRPLYLRAPDITLSPRLSPGGSS
ncbi:MAG: tRNA (adenosine(37)-N6)-threonylcarbamoyltransferase complex dimerization subunit type 1 TsaB [Actinomycetota bacterium]|nr:tRNA (adenosine(37)-N6)-threonylcarbamoyltransferase complex dimerization subunit type 1 TsaB [Actinomycetota bacterium]